VRDEVNNWRAKEGRRGKGGGGRMNLSVPNIPIREENSRLDSLEKTRKTNNKGIAPHTSRNLWNKCVTGMLAS
jgi:hypothetical protein